MDPELPRIGEIVELFAVDNPDSQDSRYEIISVDPGTCLIEARACEANADGEHTHIRMRLHRLQ
jgi:hypothetical protein